MRKSLVVAVAAVLAVLLVPGVAVADPAADLAAAQTQEATSSAEVKQDEQRLKAAESAEAPVKAKAEAAEQAVEEAEEEADEARDRTVAERRDAADEVEAAEEKYDDEQSTHDTNMAIGIAAAGFAVLLALAAFGYSRFGKWPLSRLLTQGLGALVLLIFVGGLVLAFATSSPEEPQFSSGTTELAEAAQDDPADPPSPAMDEAEAKIPPLDEAAEPLQAQWKEASEETTKARLAMESAEGDLLVAERKADGAEEEIEQAEHEENEEAEFREQATSIDYNQLLKNPERYRGEKVAYTGQIFQIIEEGGFGGFMLLSVTDEGYGFWTDNIWVNFEEPIEAAEEDIITVYGKVTGAESYETQIGGETFVPRVQAKYIDE